MKRIWVIFQDSYPIMAFNNANDAVAAFDRLKLCTTKEIELKHFVEVDD